jgi:hypothetical protein
LLLVWTKEQRRFQFTVKKITLSSFLVIVLVTSKYTTLFRFSIEHVRLRMKGKVDGVVVHSLGFSAEGSGFESRPRPHFVPPLKKKIFTNTITKNPHVWGGNNFTVNWNLLLLGLNFKWDYYTNHFSWKPHKIWPSWINCGFPGNKIVAHLFSGFFVVGVAGIFDCEKSLTFTDFQNSLQLKNIFLDF